MRQCFIQLLAILVAVPIAGWARWQERRILRHGRPLSPREASWASAAGVCDVAAIRLLVVDTIPMPGPRWLHRLAQGMKFPAMTAAGMSLGQGIYLVQRYAHNRQILVHESVHCGQYERLGFYGFLRCYLAQCLEHGYVNAPLEQEAVQRAADTS